MSDTKVDKNYFRLSGLGGALIAVVGLLATMGVLTYYAIVVQQNEAVNYYEIDQDLNSIKAISKDNKNYYKLVKTGGE